MDIIGTVGAIVGIIDVATRSISTLADVRKRYSQANLTVELLYGQLVTIRTALDQIHHLIEESLQDDQHYQLVMNMGIAINSCNLLIRVLDEHISKLEYNEDENLTFESRARVVLESKGIEECLNRLDRQMSALNLIITAYNARHAGRQRELMENKKSQQIFNQVKDDSTSLYVLCDNASFVTKRTKTTTATSRLSMNFTFDAELLRHRAYKSTFRSLLRREVARQSHTRSSQPSGPSPEDLENAKMTATIDRQLQEDSRRLRTESLILAIGSDAPAVVYSMKMVNSNGISEDERKSYCNTIRKALLSELRLVMNALAEGDAEASNNPEFEVHNQALNAIWSDGTIPDEIDADTVKTLRWCADHSLANYLSDSSEEYFTKNVERILEPDYVPSNGDIARIPSKRSGTSESRFQTGHLTLRILEANIRSVSECKKWIHAFEGATSIIFTADLACYDQVASEESNRNRMMETLALFEYIANSKLFVRTSIMLLLCNVDILKRKLATSPLQNHFKDYSGGNNPDKAAKYILWRFNQVNKTKLDLYPHVVELDSAKTFQFVSAVVKETIINQSLKDSRLF